MTIVARKAIGTAILAALLMGSIALAASFARAQPNPNSNGNGPPSSPGCSEERGHGQGKFVQKNPEGNKGCHKYGV